MFCYFPAYVLRIPRWVSCPFVLLILGVFAPLALFFLFIHGFCSCAIIPDLVNFVSTTFPLLLSISLYILIFCMIWFCISVCIFTYQLYLFLFPFVAHMCFSVSFVFNCLLGVRFSMDVRP